MTPGIFVDRVFRAESESIFCSPCFARLRQLDRSRPAECSIVPIRWLFVDAILLGLLVGARTEMIQKWETPDGELYFGDRPPAGSTKMGEKARTSHLPTKARTRPRHDLRGRPPG